MVKNVGHVSTDTNGTRANTTCVTTTQAALGQPICVGLVLRRRRRGSVTTRKPHQYWYVRDLKNPTKSPRNGPSAMLALESTHTRTAPKRAEQHVTKASLPISLFLVACNYLFSRNQGRHCCRRSKRLPSQKEGSPRSRLTASLQAYLGNWVGHHRSAKAVHRARIKGQSAQLRAPSKWWSMCIQHNHRLEQSRDGRACGLTTSACFEQPFKGPDKPDRDELLIGQQSVVQRAATSECSSCSCYTTLGETQTSRAVQNSSKRNLTTRRSTHVCLNPVILSSVNSGKFSSVAALGHRKCLAIDELLLARGDMLQVAMDQVHWRNPWSKTPNTWNTAFGWTWRHCTLRSGPQQSQIIARRTDEFF